MKRIVLINSYCNTEEKIKVLLDNLTTLKDLGLDVMLYSPILLPNEVLELCDYFILNKENTILNFPKKGVFTYRKWDDYTIKKMLPDYGWASIYQTKKLSDFALTLDYTHFYHIIYDLVIDFNVINNIYSDKNFNFFKFHEHPCSLHFMIFNRENLIEFNKHLTLDNYLSNPSFIAESFLHHVLKQLDCIIEDSYVEDKIFYYGGDDQFNYSPVGVFKFFIAKDFYKQNNIKLFFYDVGDEEEVNVVVNGLSFTQKIQNFSSIDLGFNELNSNQILINGLSINNKIKEVIHNTLEINNI